MSCKNDKIVNCLKAKLSFNDDLLYIITSICKRLREDLFNEYKDYYVKNGIIPEDIINPEIIKNEFSWFSNLYLTLMFLYDIADSDLNFIYQLTVDWNCLDEQDLNTIKLCVDELCERTDDIIEWLNQTEKEIYEKQYHQYLMENGYYD